MAGKNNLSVMIQAVLDNAKSLRSLKSDLKNMEPKLPKIKIQGNLDTLHTKKNINSQIKAIKTKIKIDADTAQAANKIKKLSQQKSIAAIQPTIDNTQVKNGLNQTQKETKSLLHKLIGSAVGANLTRMLTQSIIQGISQAFSNIKELDTIKTSIQMASGKEDSDVDSMMNSYNSIAKELSSTTKEVSEAADALLRMGESVKNTDELIKNSQMLSKIGKIGAEDAASYLISSMKGYKITAEESISIVDKLTAADAKATVSAGGLAEALSKCSYIANSSGTSIDRLIGYLTVVGEETQNSMSEVGSSFASIYSRIGNIKIGRLTDNETNESLSTTETTLNKFGIKLRDTEDTYRDFDDVLDNVGTRWSDFNQAEKDAISTAIAGTKQRENIIALMDHYSEALSYSETAANSAGTALELYGVYQDSIEAKTNVLTASLESLSTNAISEDLFKGIVSATSGLVTFIDKANLLKGALSGIAAMGAARLFVSMAAGIMTASRNTAQLTSVMTLFRNGRNDDDLYAIGNACIGLDNKYLKLILSAKGLINADRLLILEGMQVEESQRQQMLTTLGFASAENVATGSTFSFKGALDALYASFAANPIGMTIMAISAFVSAAAMAFSFYDQQQEKNKQKLQEAADAVDTAKSKLESINAELERQSQAMNELSSKDKLTYIEKGQLEELQAVTKELLIQQDIAQKELARAQKKSAQEVVKSYEKQYGDFNISKEGVDDFVSIGQFNPYANKDNISANIADVIRLHDFIDEIERKLSNTAGNYSKVELDYLQEDFQFYTDWLRESEEMLEASLTDLEDKRQILSPQYKDIADKKDTTPLTTDETKALQTYESISNAIRLIYEFTDKNKWNSIQISDIINSEDIEKTKKELVQLAKEGNLNPEILSNYSNLNQLLNTSDLFLENGQTNAEAFCEELYAIAGANQEIQKNEAAVIFISDIFSLKDSDDNVTALSDIKNKLSDIESAYQTCFSAREEFDKQGYLSIDTLEKLISLGDDYLDFLLDEEGQVRLDADAFQNLAQARLNEMEAQTLKNLAENITQITNEAAATDYLASKQDELANSYGDVAANALIAMSSIDGFSSSKPLQDAYNSFKTQYDQIKGLFANTKKGLSDKFSGKTNNSSSSNSLKEAFTKEYNTLKHNLEMEFITEKEYYDQLTQLNNKYFAGKSEYLNDYRKNEEEIYKGLLVFYKNNTKTQMDLLEKQLDNGIITYEQYTAVTKSLLYSMYSEGKLSAEDYYSYTKQMLEKQSDIYDKVLSTVTRRFDKEIDNIQDTIDSIEKQNEALQKQKDKYDNVVSAVNVLIDSKKEEVQSSITALEKENDSLNKQVSQYDSVLNAVQKVYEEKQDALRSEQDAIQERIDSLKEENDEHKRAVELQKAKYELERSKNQRSQFVFDGEQFIYTTDSNAIRENQEKVNDLELEQTITGLEKEKEALQELIDQLDRYKNIWSEISNTYQEAKEKEIAESIFGENFSQEILQNRGEDLETFKNRYLAAQQQIDDNTSMIESYEQKLEYYESLKMKWDELSAIRENEINRQIAAELFGSEWETLILEDRLISYDLFKNNYLGIQQQLEDNSGLIASCQEKMEYYNKLKDEWSNIADEYQNSIDDQYAAMVLGKNWESEILSGRMTALNAFKNDYISIQEALAQADVDRYNIQVNAAQNAANSVNSANASIKNKTDISANYGSKSKGLYKVVSTANGKVLEEGFSTNQQAAAWIRSQNGLPGMKIQAYSTGGMVGKKGDPFLDLIAESVGEDHLIAVREGELVLPESPFGMLNHISSGAEQQMALTFAMQLGKMKENQRTVTTKEMVQSTNFNFGNINVHGVQNGKDFADEILTHFPGRAAQALHRTI